MRKALVVLSCIALAAVWFIPGTWNMGQSSSATLQPTYDFGDAEYLASWGGYPTLLAQNGARHLIGGPWLGDATDAPDSEADGQPETTARGDDNLDGNDDENGAIIPVLIPGHASDIRLEVSGGGGVVEAWIDFDDDHQWQHPGEQVFAGYLPNGVHTIQVLTSSAATVGQTAARFRISTTGGLTPTGEADDGEVEDHLVEIEAATWDYGDAPGGIEVPLYPTLLLHNGARHLIRGPWLGGVGDSPDTDGDGQPHASGLGDDTDAGWDDEDGVQIPTLIPGHPADLTVEVSGGGGYVDGWIDFDNDKTWQHPAEQVVSGYYADGAYTVPITVPGDADIGQTFGRFRISDEGGLTPVGPADYGEVEDYQVAIDPKWEQLPDLDTTGIANTIGNGIGSSHYILDDFECRLPGYITEIELWVAMHQDDPITFVSNYTARIYSSVPDTASGGGTTLPDSALWWAYFGTNQHPTTIWDADIREGWHRGYTLEFPADTSCWHVKLSIEPEDAFYQTGTAEDAKVYWLWISAATVANGFELGWKASDEHWGAPAMRNTPIVYPPGHAYAGQNIDMAFRLTSQPGLELDWGDAPDGVQLGSYPTLYAHDGARHIIAGPWLGDMAGGPDPELDGQPQAQALGDDEAGQDDEGGVQIPVLEKGESAMLTIDVNGGGGFVQGWIDFNGDQDWDGSELVVAQWLADGTHSHVILVPTGPVTGESFARFRISTLGDLDPTGRAEDGEVEDYRVVIQDPGTGVKGGGLPWRYELHQAVPNPFNPATTIRYDVPPPGGLVTIRIYDVAGRLVRTLIDARQNPGEKQVKWYGLNDRGMRVASGVYFCRMTAAGFEQTRKMVLIQ
jgi:hypothetical protein